MFCVNYRLILKVFTNLGAAINAGTGEFICPLVGLHYQNKKKASLFSKMLKQVGI